MSHAYSRDTKSIRILHQHRSLPQLAVHAHHDHPHRPMLPALEEAHALNTTLKLVTDGEWNRRVKEWEKERQIWLQQMIHNCVWALGSPTQGGHEQGACGESSVGEELVPPDEILSMLNRRTLFGLDPTFLHGPEPRDTSGTHVRPTHTQIHPDAKHPQQSHQKRIPQQRLQPQGHKPEEPIQSKGHKHPDATAQPSSGGQKQSKLHKKMSRLELLKYLTEWDKVSYGRRDQMLVEFIRQYRTKENVYDSDALFHCGGSLIFGRFAISMQMSFLKHRLVWHYFDALSIFVKSLQGDKYTEEFLRLGGLGFICEIIRVEVSGQADKLHACKFLVDMMKARNSIAVKMFICDNPHFLESLVDSLTMCKDKKLVSYCGLCFENLCIEATTANILIVTSYVMRLLPCDFNPAIQSMAFRVLQSVIRLKPTIAGRCMKPILDNLKTEDMDLLVEMSNLSLVILQTEIGFELIAQLMGVAEGIQLREHFKSVFKPHMRKNVLRDKHGKEHALELRKAREKHERVKQRLSKFDHYMQQAGALFVINRMMTNKIEFVAEFTRQGIFGLSLKTLGSSPHWQVQGQGVTMVQFLHAISVECAISYFLMLPDKMMKLILEKPAECLRYFTAPICVHLRKLGRFALHFWDQWVEKVVIPAQHYADDGVLPEDFFEMCQMTKKVAEIQQAISDLLDDPVMESHSKTPELSTMTGPSESEEDIQSIIKEFLTNDEGELSQFKSGKDLINKGRHFRPFREYMDFNTVLSEDKLDIKVDKAQLSGLLPGSTPVTTELSALEQTILEDAEKNQVTATPSQAVDGDSNKPRNSTENVPEDDQEFTDEI